MHTCISLHGLKRSWCSCPRRVNAGNKNTPSTHHPRRRNVTTLMVGLKNGHIHKNLTQKVVNPRGIAGERKKQKKPKQKSTVSLTVVFINHDLLTWWNKLYFCHSLKIRHQTWQKMLTCTKVCLQCGLVKCLKVQPSKVYSSNFSVHALADSLWCSR